MKYYKPYLILLLLFSLLSYGQIPAYYSGINFDQNGSDLETDLSQLITFTHTTELPYSSSSTDTWDAVKQTDLVPGDTENVLLFYGYDDFDGISQTDYTRHKDLQQPSSSCIGFFNREHVYAKSIANPLLDIDSPGSGTDVHNLRTCDCQMNSSRSNRLFEDDSGDSHVTAGGKWYPGDEWKGDVARIIMYMHLRYPSQCPANAIGVGSNTYDTDMKDVFLDWNVEDPVSAYETQRNTVLESMQGNRNPFIDNPYIATKIWGGTAAEETWGVLNAEDYELSQMRIYPTLVKERIYISNSSNDEIDTVIYNISGQEINITINDNYLDVRSLSKGVYFLKVIQNASSSSFKFIKD